MSTVATLDYILNRARAETLACEEMHNSLAVLATAAERKNAIMDARSTGLINDEQTTLLIQAYQLETA